MHEIGHAASQTIVSCSKQDTQRDISAARAMHLTLVHGFFSLCIVVAFGDPDTQQHDAFLPPKMHHGGANYGLNPALTERSINFIAQKSMCLATPTMSRSSPVSVHTEDVP